MSNKATKADIKFYKGVLLIEIQRHLNHNGEFYSIEELDNLIKYESELIFMSCSEMTTDQMQDLKEGAKKFATDKGMGEGRFDADEIRLNWN